MKHDAAHGPPGDEAAAYALDALPPQEERDFERHLERCTACAAEVGSMRETAALLAGTVAARPPPELRDALLNSIEHPRPSQPRRAPVRRVPHIAQLVLAACLAAVVTLTAVTALRGTGGGGDGKGQAAGITTGGGDRGAMIAAVLAASDVRMSRKAIGDARASLVYSKKQGQFVLVTAGMRALPESRAYQVWLIGPEGTRSAGLLPPSANGVALVAGRVAADDRVGVTLEPAGGSRQPTSAPLAVLRLPSP
ncbi:anti-sigma factor [Nonomuraea sp. NPDC046570]|uniref:anti-sigma factor n=1 Tax=Nonomuraea sp. NPDC046570 TaxID=3155255 RepID=UPI0033F13472